MFSFFLGIYLGMELLGFVVALNPTFLGTTRYSETAVCILYIVYCPLLYSKQLQCIKVSISSFSTILVIVSWVVCLSFNYSHLVGCEVVSPCGFDFPSPND